MTISDQKSVLIDSIKKEAQDEAQKILDSAHRVVKERTRSTDEQIMKMKAENDAKQNQQVHIIAQNGMRKIESLKRKQLLALKADLVNHVVDRVKEKFNALLTQPEFREMIIGWTVEAALGLAESDPVIKASASCRSMIDDDFLTRAVQRYRELTGKELTITLASDVISRGIGIVLEAKNGKTGYNNLLETRLDRQRDTIQAIVLKDIFNE
jgi:vacuolar-type H+-ATPase subunit E/Vma4